MQRRSTFASLSLPVKLTVAHISSKLSSQYLQQGSQAKSNPALVARPSLLQNSYIRSTSMASFQRSRRLVLATSIFPNLLRLLRIPFAALALPTTPSSSSDSSTLASSANYLSFLDYARPTMRTFAEAPETPPGSAAYWLKLAVVLCLVLIGGILAGLT